jgi:c(7)-type cytochrome triheme protein
MAKHRAAALNSPPCATATYFLSGVNWGTHPNQFGHQDFPGCFRCHNDQLVSQDPARTPIGADCGVCHAVQSVGEPVSQPAAIQLTSGARSGIAGSIPFETAAGTVRFDHATHAGYENGNCTTCHNRLFPMGRSPLAIPDLHRAAEAAETSCAGCHAPGGSAFASAGNCSRCHANLSPAQPLARIISQAQPSRLPAEVRYATPLGEATFDHSRHADRGGTTCANCHNRLFPMASADLNYGADLHRAAEAARTSCAGCHYPGGEAFASAGNCARCHAGLGQPRVTASSGRSGVPELPNVETRLGPARFDHPRHVGLAQNNCQTCHNKIFPPSKGPLNYADNRTGPRRRIKLPAALAIARPVQPSAPKAPACAATSIRRRKQRVRRWDCPSRWPTKTGSATSSSTTTNTFAMPRADASRVTTPRSPWLRAAWPVTQRTTIAPPSPAAPGALVATTLGRRFRLFESLHALPYGP